MPDVPAMAEGGKTMTEPFIIAKIGDRVTTDKGETIAYVKREIWSNDMLDPEDFDWIGKPTPKHGDVAGDGFRRNPETGMPQVCIEKVWRP